MTHGGGITGLVISTTVDTTGLTAQDADTLRARVAEANLGGLPPAAPYPGAPGSGQYELTVEDAGSHHTVVLAERDLPDAVRSLIAWVRSAPGREESVSPPG